MPEKIVSRRRASDLSDNPNGSCVLVKLPIIAPTAAGPVGKKKTPADRQRGQVVTRFRSATCNRERAITYRTDVAECEEKSGQFYRLSSTYIRKKRGPDQEAGAHKDRTCDQEIRPAARDRKHLNVYDNLFKSAYCDAHDSQRIAVDWIMTSSSKRCSPRCGRPR